MHGVDFVSDVLRRVEEMGQGFASGAYGQLGGTLGTVLNLALILYIMFWGLQLWTGQSQISIGEIIWRMVRMFLIVTLVTNWGTFQVLVYDVLARVPENAGTLIIEYAQGTPSNATHSLSSVWNSVNTAGEAMIKNSGLRNPGPFFMAIVIYVIAGIFLAVALGLLMLAKIALWVLIAVAPIFIIAALFGYTGRYFNGWFGQLMTYALVPLFVFVLLGFMLAILDPMVRSMVSASQTNTISWTEIARVMLMCIVGAFVLLQVPAMTAGIAGGFPLQAASFFSFANRVASSFTRMTVRGGMWGAQQGWQRGVQPAASYAWRNRQELITRLREASSIRNAGAIQPRR